ncbi:peptide/nickel transport system substrate-binding protein [Silvibacterium bohemicum]|uniref:Peptide/nickel transport system substrate-binding protein n=1 Tax=Silvibacterium bohemicum TaxID=1577686 RepID=A0A841JY46_9BACT|nr:ABC transporter substrate-binding protein [Silvibacterium bohemicum]MBB6143358.1 peptide/nickel transport system substrate-binding protein [Silvibacterium bohemicum]
MASSLARALCASLMLACVASCSRHDAAENTVTMLIESSPTNLDPRVGTDAQSERIDPLIFDSLVERNNNFGLDPELAERWEIPNPLTYIFHLRQGVKFQNGQLLTSRDVKWTLDSLLNGTVVTIKSGAYRTIQNVEAPDDSTVVIHMKKPDPAFIWNLCDGAFGVVPYGSGRDFWRHPVGSGAFRFVSQETDKDVVVERSPNYWGPAPHIDKIRFAVVPDSTTRALELEKGSADIEINALPPDMVDALRRKPSLAVENGPGTVLNYIVFNVRDPLLKDARVRRAIALAINRPLIIQSLLRGLAREADSIFPPEQPAYWSSKNDPTRITFDPAQASALLDAAGYHRGPDGIRFHLGMKTSTDETTRLLSVIVQQQLAQIGIALDLRSYEFATFYADLTKGAFQLAPSRWIGGNEQPDIFHYAYSAASFPPHGGNRGYYASAELDHLLDDAAASIDPQHQRADYVQVQQILARDLPSINLWYLDTVVVHSRRLGGVHTSPSGNFEFLRTATLTH